MRPCFIDSASPFDSDARPRHRQARSVHVSTCRLTYLLTCCSPAVTYIQHGWDEPTPEIAELWLRRHRILDDRASGSFPRASLALTANAKSPTRAQPGRASTTGGTTPSADEFQLRPPPRPRSPRSPRRSTSSSRPGRSSTARPRRRRVASSICGTKTSCSSISGCVARSSSSSSSCFLPSFQLQLYFLR